VSEIVDSVCGEDFAEVCATNDHALGQGCVLLGWRGSVAHGTYVPPEEPDAFDDRDLMGVVVPDEEYALGLREFGSRGTVEVRQGQWDVVCYEWRKALRLLAKGNPNMLALLWMPDEMYAWIEPAGRMLLDRRELFSSMRAYPAFRGYAQGQLRKMFSGSYQGYMGEKRKELFDRYGYDVKQASHLVRILRQGIEFLDTGRMTVDRREAGDAEELLEIKRGEWSKYRVERLAHRLDENLETFGRASKLPGEPDWGAINRLAVQMAQEAWSS